MLTKEIVTNDIKQISQKINKVPTCREYQLHGTYDLGTVYHLFGSWNHAKSESLGISMRPYRIPKENVIQDLLAISSELNRVPSKNEYNQYGQYTYPAVVAKFGSWNKALRLVFGSTHEDIHSPKAIICEHCKQVCYQIPSQIAANKHHFCSLSCSSSFMQKHKKYGTNKSKMEIYLQAKLKIHYPDLEISYNNRKEIGLELDIYISHLSLAFEVNGIFHYKPIYGQSKLDKTIKYDLEKQRKCKELGIKLIVLDISGENAFKTDHAEKVWDSIATELKTNVKMA